MLYPGAAQPPQDLHKHPRRCSLLFSAVLCVGSWEWGQTLDYSAPPNSCSLLGMLLSSAVTDSPEPTGSSALEVKNSHPCKIPFPALGWERPGIFILHAGKQAL